MGPVISVLDTIHPMLAAVAAPWESARKKKAQEAGEGRRGYITKELVYIYPSLFGGRHKDTSINQQPNKRRALSL